jgi:hypothetical protein
MPNYLNKEYKEEFDEAHEKLRLNFKRGGDFNKQE